jgi:acyl-CoA thioesterase
MADNDPEKLRAKLKDFAARFPLFNLLGVEVVEVNPGVAKARVLLRDDLKNANGVMHGGVIATLIDISIAQAMLMTDEFGRVRDTRGSMTSVDLRVKYLRPLSAGYATCVATIPHLGKRLCHASAIVSSDEGKPIALGDSTVMLTLGDAAR